MNENKFEIYGVIYKSVAGVSDCMGCEFDDDSIKCVSSPSCNYQDRDDGRNVIYVKDEQ